MKRIFSGILTLLFFLFFASSVSPVIAEEYSIEFGKVETVYDWSTQKCSSDDINDSPARALIDGDGNVQLYAAHETNRKFIGPNLSDVRHDCHVIMESHRDPDPRTYNSHEWLTAPYTLDGNIIYSLIHNEYHGYDAGNQCNDSNPDTQISNCWWNSVNLAKSIDKGYTFTHANPHEHNISNTSIDYNPDNKSGSLGIFGSTNIISKDGYYYTAVIVRGVPLNDLQYKSCIMRTDNLDDSASWRFWDGNGFNVPTRGIPASGNCQSVGNIPFDLHWSTYLNQYINAFAANVAGTGKMLLNTSYASSFMNWSNKTIEIPASIMPSFASYTTLLQPGAETRNFEDVGRSPWLYFVICDAPDCAGKDYFYGFDRNLKRVRVRFNKPEDVGRYDVLDLRFNEYTGTKTLDSSFYGNDGTLSGNTTFKREGETKFANFSGSGGVSVPASDSLNRQGEITILAKIRTSQHPATNTFASIITKEVSGKRNYGLYMYSDGRIHFSLSNGTSLAGSFSNVSINDGAWHTVEVNFSDSTGKAVYIIDGNLDAAIAQGGKLQDGISNAPLLVGGNSFVGDLDQVTIFNYSTSQTSSTTTNQPSIKKGDLNGDGNVNIDDFNLLLTNFGKTGSSITGDIDINGKVDIFDYNFIVTNYGK